jgi:hypothetical protein
MERSREGGRAKELRELKRETEKLVVVICCVCVVDGKSVIPSNERTNETNKSNDQWKEKETRKENKGMIE